MASTATRLAGPLTLGLLLRIIQFFLAFFGAISIAAFFGKYHLVHSSETAFYVFVATTTIIINFVWVLCALIPPVAAAINGMALTVRVYAQLAYDAIWSVFWLAGASAVAKVYSDGSSLCDYYSLDCGGLVSAVVFGFFTLMAFIATLILGILELRDVVSGKIPADGAPVQHNEVAINNLAPPPVQQGQPKEPEIPVFQA
ncbi:hypothetical protein HK104_000567 [Borealophlyctis nickersoniae]|nr:hypothetical protein HK104_000567 [Borealophlyctis nickersoniae]